MSEMYRPAPPLAAPDHERHDALLVAQLAAGDPLDPARADEARSWLASCPECARLASELSSVRAAVASEPVPPRRRDFRLAPEQAEALAGNALTRFLRGLSLPRARAFAPAAAGLLSVGLVFVVAGYAWPEGDSLPVGSDVEVAPAAVQEVAPTAGEERTVPAPADADALEFFTTHPDALEDALSNQVGAPPRSEAMRKAIEAEAVGDEATVESAGELEEGAAAAPELQDVPPAEAVTQGAAERAFSTPTGADAPEDDLVRDAAGGGTLDAADEVALGATAEAADGAGLAQSAEAPEPVAVEPVAAEPASDGSDDAGLERWLVLVGALFAVAGGALLLLGWLSRRASDPLLR